MKLSDDASRNIYRAAYDGFERGFSSFEVCYWSEDDDARPMSSGCSYQAGGIAIFENVSESDFGDWSIEDTTEDEFVDYCMDVFGNIEVPEDDD
jgi:hypothetical protein